MSSAHGFLKNSSFSDNTNHPGPRYFRALSTIPSDLAVRRPRLSLSISTRCCTIQSTFQTLCPKMKTSWGQAKNAMCQAGDFCRRFFVFEQCDIQCRS
jgi:hypothetical protein